MYSVPLLMAQENSPLPIKVTQEQHLDTYTGLSSPCTWKQHCFYPGGSTCRPSACTNKLTTLFTAQGDRWQMAKTPDCNCKLFTVFNATNQQGQHMQSNHIYLVHLFPLCQQMLATVLELLKGPKEAGKGQECCAVTASQAVQPPVPAMATRLRALHSTTLTEHSALPAHGSVTGWPGQPAQLARLSRTHSLLGLPYRHRQASETHQADTHTHFVKTQNIMESHFHVWQEKNILL